MHVAKWGNSLAIRLPRKLVEALGIKEGDELAVVAAEDRVLAVEKHADRQAALARMAARGWTLPPDYRFDRDEANAR